MTLDESNPPTPEALDANKNQPGVLCQRCDHLNHGSREECEDCGAPLYVECAHCGERAARVFTRCPHCRHRLRHRGSHGRRHGGKHRRPRSSVQRANRLLLWAIGIIIILFVAAGVILMRFKG